LSEAYESISTKSAIHHFIFTLGTEFDTIQNNFCLGNLPEAWETNDWPSILALCHDYYNSVNPHGPPKKNSTPDGSDSQHDCAAHHKKIRQWFLQPDKYCVELTNEQNRYPGKCIYHLTKSHATSDCNVKHECDKLIADKKKSSTTPASTVRKLRHIQDKLPETSVSEDNVDIEDVVLDSTTGNDTNKADLMYFSCMTNHYLRLVWSTSKSDLSRSHMQYPIIADSGANFHMFREQDFFTLLWLEVLLRPRFTLLMKTSNSYLNLFRLWNFWMPNSYLCLLEMSFTMIIRHVSTGPRHAHPKVLDIFK